MLHNVNKALTYSKTTPKYKVVSVVYWTHRHLREIDCSSAIVGGPAAGAVSGGKSIHWTRMWRQKVLHSGCCGWRHNYYDQQRQAGRANEQSTSLRCLWFCPTLLKSKVCYSRVLVRFWPNARTPWKTGFSSFSREMEYIE